MSTVALRVEIFHFDVDVLSAHTPLCVFIK